MLPLILDGRTKLLRREKETKRKTLKKIREQGEANSELFWSDLCKKKEGKKRTNIEEQDGMSSRKPGRSGRRTSQALGGVGKQERE